jgi:two-component system, NtrC family, sensor kinase
MDQKTQQARKGKIESGHSGRRFVSLLRITALYAFLWPILVVVIAHWFHSSNVDSPVHILGAMAVSGALSLLVVVFVRVRIVVPLRDLTFAIRDRRPDVLERIARRSSLLELHRMIASFSGYFASEEESRRRLAGALQEKTIVLEETRAGLRHTERLSSLGRMVAGIAHEIHNPASYVSGNLVVLGDYLDTLKHRLVVLDEILEQARTGDCSSESLDAVLTRLDNGGGASEYQFAMEELPNLIDAMGEGMDRISNIVRSLRLFTHREVPIRELVNVRSALHNAIGILRSRLHESVELNVSCDHPVGVLMGPGQMEQILINLLANAVEAQPEGGAIVVEILDRDDEATITVADHGPGIPEDDLERIFEPFYTTKPMRTNSGLGLAVVNEIVHRSDGVVTVHTDVGAGTTVTIRLPLEPFPVEEL